MESTEEDLSGQLWTDSTAESSTCTIVTATLLQPEIHQPEIHEPEAPQTSTTLPSHKAIVDASPDKINSDVDMLQTPNVMRHGVFPSSAWSDNKTTYHSSNRNDGAVPIKHDVEVRNQAHVPGRFQLNRSPTISAQDCDGILLQTPRLQLDPSSDEAESNDGLLSEDESKEVSSNRATQSTRETSPSLSITNEIQGIYPILSNDLLGVQDHREVANLQGLEDDELNAPVRI
jgi:hypothetical protein